MLFCGLVVPAPVPNAYTHKDQTGKQHRQYSHVHIHVVHAVLRVRGLHGGPAAVHALPGRLRAAQTIPVLWADGRAVGEGGAEVAGAGIARGGHGIIVLSGCFYKAACLGFYIIYIMYVIQVGWSF